jgi:hypothetical protein
MDALDIDVMLNGIWKVRHRGSPVIKKREIKSRRVRGVPTFGIKTTKSFEIIRC